MRRGAGAAAPPQPSRGVRGSMRDRLMTEMVDQVEGGFKILIADTTALEILNSVVKMHDLMDHGVTLVENINNKRQPVPQSQAIYFITPTRAHVDLVISDWALKDPYTAAHVFFTSTAPEQLIQMFAGSRVASKLKSLKDLLIDFAAPESLLFSLNMKYDIPAFFGPATNPTKYHQAAAQIVSVLQTLKDAAPVIRHQDSPAAKAVAMRVQEVMDAVAPTLVRAHGAASGGSSGGGGGGADGKVTLLVLDRSFDLNTSVLHDLNYQAMLWDLMPLKDGVYEQHYSDGAGKDQIRRVPIDESDATWYRFRLDHIANLMRSLPQELQALYDANPQLAQATKMRGGAASLSELGEAVRSLPAFQEKQAKLSLHIDIVSRLFNTFKVQSLRDVIDLEQRIATGENADGTKASYKEMYESLMQLARDASVPKSCKERLVIMLVVNEGANLSVEKRERLLHAMGLGAELNQAVEALAHFSVAVEKDKKRAPAKPRKTSSQQDALDLSRYVPKLHGLLEQAVGDSLSTAEFPFTRLPAGGSGGSGGPGAAVTAAPRSLRTAAPRFATALGRGASSERVLALPHGTNISLGSGNKLVVFFVGGVTMSEVRLAYKQVEALHHEIIIGGTSILTPTDFLSQLSILGMS